MDTSNYGGKYDLTGSGSSSMDSSRTGAKYDLYGGAKSGGAGDDSKSKQQGDKGANGAKDKK